MVDNENKVSDEQIQEVKNAPDRFKILSIILAVFLVVVLAVGSMFAFGVTGRKASDSTQEG